MAAANSRLGPKIKQARAERGWKQKHLAAEVAVEPITVSRWERGATTPDLDVLGEVAAATGKPLSFFVDDVPARARDGGASMDEAVARIEAAAARIAAEAEALAELLSAVRDELSAARGRAK